MPSLAREERSTLDRWAPWGLGVALALLMWAPVLGRGYVLAYDMVFVPHPALDSRSLGVEGGVPRAVPGDFLVAAATHVVPGWLLQQLLLVGLVVLGCVGAWRMSPARTVPAAGATAVLWTWNPYVAERLAMGHWSLLVGYAVLPWLVVACGRVAARGPWRAVLLCGLGAAAAPTAGVLTAGVALAAAVVVRQTAGSRLVLSAGAVVVNLPWVLAGWASAGLLADSRAGTEIFAARADTPLGGLVSLLTFGGVWNSDVWPQARSSAFSGASSLVLVTIGVLGLVVRLRRGSRIALVVATVAVVGLALALPTLSEPGRDAFAAATEQVPALGLVRDSQKWLAWWALAVAYGLGPGLELLLRPLASWNRLFVSLAAALLAVVALPDLAWGVGGQLRGSDWPTEYTAAARVVEAAPRDRGAVLVLPFHTFRAWPWAHDHTVLDPWSRLVGRRVVVNDDLETRGGVVPGEDPLAASVRRLRVRDGTLDAQGLRALGIGVVVVDRATVRVPGDATGVTGYASVLHQGSLLTVLDLGPVTGPTSDERHEWLLAVDAAVALLLGVVAALAVVGRVRRRGDPPLLGFDEEP